jgi:BCD family chlorophyll transporter-like MFS transporter
VQNTGVLAGMIAVALTATAGGPRFSSLKAWTIAGCIASAMALFALTFAAIAAPAWPLTLSVFVLGVANGAYAVAAIGSMMGLVGIGGREGVRMGLWGAAQAIAFGTGGIIGAAGSDLARLVFGSPAPAYGIVFAAEGAMFLVAAMIAMRIQSSGARQPAKFPQELTPATGPAR